MISALLFGLLLFAVFLGYWFGVLLGLIAPEEMGYFKKFRLSSYFVTAIMPILLLFASTRELILASCVFFLALFPYGSKEVSKFVNKNNEIKDYKNLWRNALKKSSPYIVSGILCAIIYIIIFI